MVTSTSRLNVILNFRKEGAGVKAGTAALRNLDKEQVKASKSARVFSLGQAAIATAVTLAVTAFVKQIPQLVKTSFQYRNAQIALEAYTGSAFEAEQITNAVAEASGFVLDSFTNTLNATRLLSLGLATTAEEAGRLTKTAITLGATMGKDAQGAFEEFTLLLANQSILRLDTYGISAGKVRERMAELSAEFPEMDRNARFLNATLEISEEKMLLLDAAGFQATSSLDRLGTISSDAALDIGNFLADAILPTLDALFEVVDANNQTASSIFATSESFQELETRMQAANLVSFGLFEQTKFTNEELFDQAKASEVAAQALAKYNEEAEDVGLTLGGLNELIQEEEFLLTAIGAGLSGKIGAAQEKWLETIGDTVDAQSELSESTLLLRQNQTLLSNDQFKLNEKLRRGEINSVDYTAATIKLTKRQEALDKKTRDINKTQADFNKTLLEARDNLREVTAELIFQTIAKDLDQTATLLLARELGVLDESSFAAAQAALRLRIAYDEEIISAQELATGSGILLGVLDDLAATNPSSEITVEGLDFALQGIDLYAGKLVQLDGAVVTTAVITNFIPATTTQTVAGATLPDDFFDDRERIGGIPEFAHGGSFSGGSPILVGERGPEVIVPSQAGTVIPNDQVGGGGVTFNGDVFVSGEIDLAMLVAEIEEAL